jgi:urease accessory protein
MRNKFQCWSIALLFLATCGVANAHPGHVDGLLSGLTHPLSGGDHVLALVAIGIWACQFGGRATWLIPSSFMALMGVAALVGAAGFALPWGETGIATSVLVVGLLIALSVRVSPLFGAMLVALFALFHGNAHGIEMPVGISGWQYGVGFVLVSVAVYGGGVLLGKQLHRHGWVLRVAGTAIAVSGAWLIAG